MASRRQMIEADLNQRFPGHNIGLRYLEDRHGFRVVLNNEYTNILLTDPSRPSQFESDVSTRLEPFLTTPVGRELLKEVSLE